MYLFYCKDLATDTVLLNEEESKHCNRVLRKKVGDTIYLFDGNGTKAEGEVNHIGKRNVQVIIRNRSFFEPDPYFLHIAVAPTKQMSKIEWFLEKSVEFGVHEITFIETKNSERNKINFERLQKIVLTAAKQSLSSYLPKLNTLTSFKDFVQQPDLPEKKYIATLINNARPVSLTKEENCVAVIGPEGGFTQKEVTLAVESQFQSVSLGKKRLRTETAALFFSAVLYQLSLNE